MGKITAPYNFVPLNDYVYIPSWGSQISQDIPFEDGEDGYIEVTWRNVSPLCVRDASDSYEKSKDSKVYYSMNMRQPDGSRLYFLPGSSLRGMLRNTLNIMSFGKMTQYGNKYFGHRDITSDGKYRTKMDNAQCGWLEKEGDTYVLHICEEKAEKIRMEEVKALYGQYYSSDKAARESAWKLNDKIGKNTFPVYKKNGIEYRIFATGTMNGKKHEMLIPTETYEDVTLDEQNIQSFFTVYANTPDFENYRKMLDDGKQIPVTFIKEKNRYVIGMGRMIRCPYKYGIQDLAGQDISDEDKSKPDLAEAIFGWVDKDNRKAHKGRVQVGNAFSERPIADALLCDEVCGVLGSPKPSFYPLYLEQNGSKYNTYSTVGARISGKKRYRIHTGGTTMQLPQGNGNELTLSYFRPIPAGQEFKMRITLHNLRKVEIGALLSAVTFHKTEGAYHNIGSAKGYGYGKLEWHDVNLHGLRYSEDEYLAAYEDELSEFSRNHKQGSWKDAVQPNRLVSIMSEHEDADVRMMDMNNPNGDEYKKARENFSTLEEPVRKVNSLLTDEYLAAKHKADFMREHEQDYELIMAAESEENYSDAKDRLNELIDELDRQRLDKAEEETWLAELQKKEKEKAAAKAEADAAADEARRREKAEKPFAEVLEEKYEGKDKYKVDKWKTCESKVKQRLKAQGRDTLTPEDCDTLENTIRRLYKDSDRSEKKEWTKPFDKSKMWRSASKILGEERASKLYEELTNGDGK